MTTNYSIPKLKIYKKVKRYDLINEEYILISESVPVNTYKVEVIHNEPNIFWRQKMWDLAIYRSLEIWKKIPSARIDKSIGELTELARKSLGGKLGVANGTYFKKDAEKNWIFLKWKEEKSTKPFLPLSENAVKKCKERAKKYLG